MKRFRAVIAELTRRKVLRVLWIYLALFAAFFAWFVSVGAEFGLGRSVLLWVFAIGIVLIPLLAFLSWRYDIVPPQLVKDANDFQSANPALSWAMIRHDSKDAGFLNAVWQTGPSARNENQFFKPVGIGRETGNDIQLTDPKVSRRHAVIWAEKGGWHIRDLDSANGTFVDEQCINGIVAIPEKCEVRFHPNGPVVSLTVVRPARTEVSVLRD